MILDLYDVTVFVMPNDVARHAALKLHVEEVKTTDVGFIVGLHQSIGHEISPERCERRIANGLRFFCARAGGQIAGISWAVISTPRYLDEFGWLLELNQDEMWVRDIFVAPPLRGQGVFREMVVAMGSCFPCRRIWSDVDTSNRPSIRAHTQCGFVAFQRLRGSRIAGRILVRSSSLDWHRPIAFLHPDRGVVYLGGQTLRLHRDLIA